MVLTRKFSLFLIVLVLIFPLGMAVHDYGIDCTSDDECVAVCEQIYEEGCYCGEDNICASDSDSDAPSAPSGNATGNATARAANTTNATVSQLNGSIVGVNASYVLGLEQRIKVLENSSAALQRDLTSTKSTLSSVQQQVAQVSSSFSQELDQVSTTIQDINSQQVQVSTGLASLQQNINQAQEELTSLQSELERKQAFNRMIVAIVLVIGVILLALGIVYFITRKGSGGNMAEEEINPEVLKYITTHIKQGKKFPHIRDSLVKAGWDEEDVIAAYRATMRKNYTEYQQKGKAGKNAFDRNKAVVIGVMTILLILGVFFIIRGVTTGKAIEFSTQELLEAAVEANLKTFVPNNAFYSLVPKGTICVEVRDGQKSVSYRIVKTPKAHAIAKAPMPCSADPNRYDAAVQFNTWQSFNVVSRRMDCATFAKQHGSGFYVLPSKLVLPGFTLNPQKDASLYCGAISKCLIPEQLTKAGISC